MKNVFLSCALLMMAMHANASENLSEKTYQHAFELISQNQKLQAGLSKLGFSSVNEAAEKFKKESETLSSAGIHTDLGTLAICMSLDVGIGDGGNARACSSLSNSYLVYADTVGLQAEMSTSLDAIYFTNSNTSNASCYHGLYWGGAYGVKLGNEALNQVKCEESSEKINSGFFMGFGVGVGIGGGIGSTVVTVIKGPSYW